ncbi:MAG TPA: two-component sensor histidine kinase [Rikenellaceae bacterium]|nr:two-component sensor histidine kinase [Rikenellaceae bacterium]
MSAIKEKLTLVLYDTGALFALVLFLTLNLFPTHLKSQNAEVEQEVYLIISSFNPDTKRSMDFINEFELALGTDYKDNAIVLIEDLGAKNFNEEAHLWKGRVASLLKKYEHKKLRAIIAIGQEAWAALLAQDTIPSGVPIFGEYISGNGIELPITSVDETWQPEWVNMSRKARRKANAGGILNHYVPRRNIDLILSFFPETKNIVFLSDNTYGGLSMKTLFKRDMNEVPNINYLFLDSRELHFNEILQSIKMLPQNTAMLIGTWRVNKDGQYFLGNSLEELISANPNLPVFTMSGTGLGSGAIGGYIPKYGLHAKRIVSLIEAYAKGDRDSVRFNTSGSSYQFDQRLLEKLKINKQMLPSESIIINAKDPRLAKYKKYLIAVSSVTVALAIFMITLFFMYSKNKRLRKYLEQNRQELIMAKERAEESDHLKSAFLANMSHEIRTPLNSIVGFSNLLISDDYTAEQRVEMNKVIAQNSELLLTLITDILDISGLETGKLNFVFRTVEVNSLCEQVLATTTHLRKASIDYRFEPTLESCEIYTDVHRLSQVLLNLLTNANKFTQQGEIVLKYELNGSHLLFSVSDTGSGIPKEQHKKLFERFGKLNTFSQGAGLGLAISKQIITNLGGRIWIDPEYSEGARFYFTHPILSKSDNKA